MPDCPFSPISSRRWAPRWTWRRFPRFCPCMSAGAIVIRIRQPSSKDPAAHRRLQRTSQRRVVLRPTMLLGSSQVTTEGTKWTHTGRRRQQYACRRCSSLRAVCNKAGRAKPFLPIVADEDLAGSKHVYGALQGRPSRPAVWCLAIHASMLFAPPATRELLCEGTASLPYLR